MLKKVICLLLPFALALTGCDFIADLRGVEYETIQADLADLGKGEPVLALTEEYSKWDRGSFEDNFDEDFNGFDIRSYDLSGVALEEYESQLEYVNYDTDTVWPEALPQGFDPREIMELGKNPGLGVRSLHDRGITGRGVSIAIIDQSLLLEHEEYADNLMLYESLHNPTGMGAQMHGPAVASIAVGETVGVAPEARLYYIASTFGTFSKDGYDEDLNYMAEGILRVLEINQALPQEEKIRAISISKGFDYDTPGRDAVTAAVEAAKAEGVLVVTTTMEANYPMSLMGTDRGLTGNPEDYTLSRPGVFWSEYFYDGGIEDKMLLVPMDSRTYASFTGTADYAFGRMGGLSWTCPWLAGMYALCAQVDPDITPDSFLEACFDTGDTIDLDQDGKTLSFGTIINPVRLIGELENE